MKNRFSFFIAVLVSMSCFGQGPLADKLIESGGKIKWGVKAGIRISNIKIKLTNNDPSIPDPGDPGTKAGIMGGAYIRLPLGKNFNFQPEILLVGKGMNENYTYYFYTTIFTYLELPLNILYKSTKTTGSFYFGGGPAPAILLDQNYNWLDEKEMSDFDFGINLLTGYEWPIGFSVNLNYTHGLLNISKYENNVTEIKNRYFGLTLGYTF